MTHALGRMAEEAYLKATDEPKSMKHYGRKGMKLGQNIYGFADRVYSHIDNGSAGAAAVSAAMAYHFTRKATKQMRRHGTPKQKFGASMLTAGAASVGALAG